MANVVLVVPVLLSACLLVAAVVVQIRANPGVRIPWVKPSGSLRDPAWAKVLRGLGVGLVLLGVINRGDRLAGWWGLTLVVGVFLPSALLLLLHNGRVMPQRAR
jgi:hypothetical protein